MAHDAKIADLHRDLGRAWTTSLEQPPLRVFPAEVKPPLSIDHVPEPPPLWIPGSTFNRDTHAASCVVSIVPAADSTSMEASETRTGEDTQIDNASRFFGHNTQYAESRAPLLSLANEVELISADVQRIRRSLLERIDVLSRPDFRPAERSEVQVFYQAGADPGSIITSNGRHFYASTPQPQRQQQHQQQQHPGGHAHARSAHHC